MSDLVERLRGRALAAENANAAGEPLVERFSLLREAADALERAQRERDAVAALIAMVPDNFRHGGDNSFWIGEYDPVHKTTGRSMDPEEREERSAVAHRVLGYVIDLRAEHVLSQTQGEEAARALSPQREETDKANG